jgi:hypothetical protein
MDNTQGRLSCAEIQLFIKRTREAQIEHYRYYIMSQLPQMLKLSDEDT